MNELKNIFKDFIDSYEAIQILERNGIFDEEEKSVHEHNLLFNIIKIMKLEDKQCEADPEELTILNADIIRSMTNEELANFLTGIAEERCNIICKSPGRCNVKCGDHIKNFVHSQVKKDADFYKKYSKQKNV